MKQWKVVLVTAVIALLVVALFVMGLKSLDTKGEQTIKERIKQYTLIRDEQLLITDIWTLRYEAAVMQAKFNPVADANAPPR